MLRQRLAAATFVLGVAMTAAALAQDPIASKTDPATAAKIHAALDSLTIMEFVETPLSEVAQHLSDYHKIDVAVDQPSLEDIGVTDDTPITRSIRGVSLRSALRILLRDLELDYMIRHGALEITTPECTEGQLITRVYAVSDLVKAGDGEAPEFDYDPLVEAIQTTLSSDYWDEVGGPATMRGLLGSLVVAQTLPNHRQIDSFLTTYRKAKALIDKDPAAKPKAASFDLRQSAASLRIRKALDEQAVANFTETPLVETIDFFKDLANIPIVLDVRALEEIGVPPDTPITLRAKNVRLRDVLNRMLGRLGLVFTIRDETLQITTIEEVESNLDVRMYPIRDLLKGDAEARGMMADNLAGTVTSAIAPSTWDEVGGPSSLYVLDPGVLVIAQAAENHDEIAKLLTTLRKQGTLPKIDAGKIVTETYLILNPTKPGTFADAATVEKLASKLPGLTSELDWDAKGVLVESLDSALIVRQTWANHRKLHKILASLHLYFAPLGKDAVLPIVH